MLNQAINRSRANNNRLRANKRAALNRKNRHVGKETGKQGQKFHTRETERAEKELNHGTQ